MRGEALDWLEGATVDLEEAKEACSRRSNHLAVFLAHQAVEKALKAYIIGFKRLRPPRTHDLVELVTLSELQLNSDEAEGIAELSPYYMIARYPNAGLRKPWREITAGTARRFVALAEKIVEKVKAPFQPEGTYS
ncbi:MAG: HEPN domain-containing protein [Candidatus Nezhaarchaeota archaeon]|nr:HEPN domain-containing protein [Candidatus Nezhaarchaeota archaeon]